jgi:cytochrome d ubiquinol oxidase subunit I
MVAIGFAMLFVGLAGVALRWRKRLYDRGWFLWLAMAMTPSGFIAVLAGWFTAETGRQPWVVYGHLRTADALSPVPAASVAASLATFFLVYVAMFGAGTYYMLKVIAAGPKRISDADAARSAERRLVRSGRRPLSVLEEGLDDPRETGR